MNEQERQRLNDRLALALRQLDHVEQDIRELATLVTSVSMADYVARKNPLYLHELAQRITSTHMLFSLIQADIAYLSALLRGDIEEIITVTGEEHIKTTLGYSKGEKPVNVYSIMPDEAKEKTA